MPLTMFQIMLRLGGAGLAAWLFATACYLPFPAMGQERQAPRAGELIWMREGKAGIAAAGAAVARHVADDQDARTLFVVGSRSGTVAAFDAADGTPVWGPIDIRRTDAVGRPEGLGIIAAPAVLSSEGVVVFALRDGRIVALDAARSGRQLWAHDLGRHGTRRPAVVAPPTVASDGLIVVATLAGVVYALDPSSGAFVWKQPYKARGPIQHAPVATLDGRLILVVQDPDRSLVALTPDGLEDRNFDPLAFGVLPTGSPALDSEGNLVAARADGKLIIYRQVGDEIAAQIDGVPAAQAIARDGGFIWKLSNLKTGEHRLERLRRSVGKVEKTGSVFEAPGEAVGDVALDGRGGAVYATRDGTLRAVTPDGKEAWVFRPEGGAGFLASPVLASGVCLVAADDGRVFAVGTGTESDTAPWPVFRHDSERRAHALGPHYLPGEHIFDAPPRGWEYHISPVNDVTTSPQLAQEESRFKRTAEKMHLRGEAPVYAIGAGRYVIRLTPGQMDDGRPIKEFPASASGRFPEPVAAGVYNGPRESTVQVYDVPVQRIEVGGEVSVPKNAYRALIPDTGPRVQAAGAEEAATEPDFRPFVWRRATRTYHAVVPGDWVIEWPVGESGQTFPVRVRVEWPRDERRIQYIVQHAQSFRVTGEGAFAHATLFKPDATFDSLPNGVFDPSGLGRFVVVLSDVPRPGEGNKLGFLPIETVGWRDASVFTTTRPAIVGQALPVPREHEDPERTPYVLNERARVIMMSQQWGFHDREERSGPIVPVNVEAPANLTDDLVLALYAKGRPVMDADGEVGKTVPPFPGWRYQARFYGDEARRTPPRDHVRAAYLPSRSVLFQAKWPEVGDGEGDADLIVIAAQNDGGYSLDPEVFANPRIYRQADIEKAGYNPNEEHAAITGDRKLWVYRSDLNVPDSSQPFVLIVYEDPSDSMNQKIKVIAVKAEDRTYDFVFMVRAGDMLRPPRPIGFTGFVQIEQSTLDESVAFRDRTGALWASRAGHDGGSVSVVNRYCYGKHESFDDPGLRTADCPGNKEMFSWLSVHAAQKRAVSGETEELNAPMDVRFDVAWPDKVPVLRPGRTLLTARDDLPAIYGQRGIQIIYQQTEARGRGSSVRLFDAVAERSAKLDNLPGALLGAKSETINNQTFFPGLPPHLRHQFYFQSPHGLRFRGRFIDEGGRVSARPASEGDAFVLMNVLDASAMASIRRTLVGEGPDFNEFRAALGALVQAAAAPLEIFPAKEGGEEAQAADGLALSATASGEHGYVTIVSGNDKAAKDAGDPVSVHVLRVSRELEVGRVIVIPHTNPFAEEVYVRHSGDFSGSADRYEFDWRMVAAVGDTTPLGGPGDWPRLLPRDRDDPSGNARLIKGKDQFAAQLVAVRYRLRSDPQRGGVPGEWSAFTDSQRIGSWLDRVVKGVNVFDDYLSDFRNAKPDAVVSAVSRVGPRYRGAVPLNVDALSRLGLIEVYETVFRRGKALGLDLGVNDNGLNESLQTFAGRLSDLYLILGDEAYADAVDPTIALPSGDWSQITLPGGDLRAFYNQTGSLLHEELALLRGVATRNTRQAPEYNRLKWELSDTLQSSLYMANYGPFEDKEGLDLGERSDPFYAAKKVYPQGHGDAYGHYLMALKVYYQLLSHPNFGWKTGRNQDSIGGRIVDLDYYDERKIAQVAVARARTGFATMDLTHRFGYAPGAEGWLSLTRQFPGPEQHNPQLKRQLDAAWGAADWASRSGQGAYFDWVTANALLPATAERRDEQLGKLDRVSVPELSELADLGGAIQTRLDSAASGVNPVGAPEDYVPMFVGRDQGLSQNWTPFKVVQSRALRSLTNVVEARNSITGARRHEIANREESRLKERVFEDEYFALNNQLIEIFGTPYSSDIGPGKSYESGYIGPDYKRFFCVSPSELLQPNAKVFEWKPEATAGEGIGVDSILITNDAWSQCVVKDPEARRATTGLIQRRMREVLLAAGALDQTVDEYRALMASIDDQSQLLQLTEKIENKSIRITLDKNRETMLLADFRNDALARQIRFARMARYARYVGRAVVEGIPKTVGFIAGLASGVISDPFSSARSAGLHMAIVMSEGLELTAEEERIAALDAERRGQILELEAASKRLVLDAELGEASRTVEFEALLRQEPIVVDRLHAHAESLRASLDAYRTAVDRGRRLLVKRNRLSALRSIDNTNRRYREVAYRLLKREAVEAYLELLDRAILDTFMLVRLFDFETNYAPEDPRAIAPALYSELSRIRTPGRLTEKGDPSRDRGGVASVLARLTEAYADYVDGAGAQVSRTQTLDIRHGLFRIPMSGEEHAGVDENYDPLWRERLRQHLVEDVASRPELRNCCDKMPEGAAIVIPFSTPVQSSQHSLGFNHFGFILGPGETGFDVDYINAKLTRVRVHLNSYNWRQLVGRPQVYLVPAGSDLFVSPKSSDGENTIRSWDIRRQDEQVIVVPSPSGSSRSIARSLWFAPRARHTSFGVLRDAESSDAEEKQAFTTQLFGRSVFNTSWFLVIPLRPLSPQLVGQYGADAEEEILRRLVGDESVEGISNVEIEFQFTARETGGG